MPLSALLTCLNTRDISLQPLHPLNLLLEIAGLVMAGIGALPPRA